jgi:hypothetical protein
VIIQGEPIFLLPLETSCAEEMMNYVKDGERTVSGIIAMIDRVRSVPQE